MTSREQQKMSQRLQELFGQVYARQVPQDWLVETPLQAAEEGLIQWVDLCLRNHQLPERVIEKAVERMRRQPLKTSDQQMEEFKSANTSQTGQPVPSSGRGDNESAGEQGDGGSTGGNLGEADRMDTRTPQQGSPEDSPDDDDGSYFADGSSDVR